MRRIFVGGTMAGLAAVVAAWVAFGVSGTPESVGATSCPLPAYPNANCTGIPAGTSLTVIDVADWTVTTSNATVDAVDVHGCIDVRAAGVTIQNSRAQCITTDQAPAIQNPATAAPLTVLDSEIDCKGHTGGTGVTGIFSRNIRVYRADIHGCENGLEMTGNVLLQDSYIHDLTQCTNAGCTEPDAHTDGIQSQEGDNVTLIHNTIYGFGACSATEHPSGCGTANVTPPGGQCKFPNDGTCNGTSAVNIGAGFASGPVVATIKDNLLAGGSFTLYCTNKPASNFKVIRNHFSRIYSPRVGEFGPASDCADGEVWQGNVYHETGQPVKAF